MCFAIGRMSSDWFKGAVAKTKKASRARTIRKDDPIGYLAGILLGECSEAPNRERDRLRWLASFTFPLEQQVKAHCPCPLELLARPRAESKPAPPMTREEVERESLAYKADCEAGRGLPALLRKNLANRRPRPRGEIPTSKTSPIRSTSATSGNRKGKKPGPGSRAYGANISREIDRGSMHESGRGRLSLQDLFAAEAERDELVTAQGGEGPQETRPGGSSCDGWAATWPAGS